MEYLKAAVKENFPGLSNLLRKGKRIIVNNLIRWQKKTLRKKIEDYHHNNPEAKEIISFLRENPIQMVPYFYTKEYRDKKIEVRQKEGFPFVEVDGNDVFFPQGMSKEEIVESVRTALIEQDEQSPHKYLPVDTMKVEGDVAVVCGASDCIYTLQIINNFNKIYLFEADPKWVEPIQKTLRNYLHKIEIVPYFISDKDSPKTIALDSFFETKDSCEVNYIQADIEGDELRMLHGAKGLLERSNNLKLSLCCYHTGHQEKELTDFLKEKGYRVNPSKGYLLLWMQFPLKAPYIRRGVLYGAK